jgi:hypothetical protein
MSEREPPAADRSWRAELRRSDPAAGEALAPAEAAEMRRAILAAAAVMAEGTALHRFRLRLGARRLLAAAAVVAVCVLAAAEWRALLPWRRQGNAPALAARRRPPGAENGPAADPAAPSTKARVGAAPPPPLLARATAAGTSPNVERSLPRERAERPAETGEAADRPATTGAPGEAATAAKAAEPMRQVQFSTPGGTRIIWLVRGERRSR